MRSGLTLMLIPLLTSIGAARADDRHAEQPEAPSLIIVDTPPAVRKAPAVTASPPPVDVPAERGPVSARVQSRKSGVSFLLCMDTGLVRGISCAPSLGVGVDAVGVTYRPGFGIGSSTTTTNQFRLICEAPCEVSLASGSYPLALSHDGGEPILVRGAIPLFRDSIVDGRYVNRDPMRKAGWSVFGIGFISGVVMMIAGLNLDADGDIVSVKNGALVGGGVALMGASVVIGVPMLTRDDKAYIDVYPMEK